jgi:hypothetical protein
VREKTMSETIDATPSEHAFDSLCRIHEMAAKTRTDKGTVHTYLDVYAALFGARRFAVRDVLEVGVYLGGSMDLWERFFPNARLLGMDITLANLKHTPDPERTTLMVKDAYTASAMAELSSRRFDIIIDDGPHTLESMLFAAQHFPGLLAEGGVLVIEDVASPEWVPRIKDAFPEHLRHRVEVVDRRAIKGRFDDLLVILRL